MEVEFAAKPCNKITWNKITSTITDGGKEDEKLRKNCGDESWSKVQRRAAKISTVLVVKVTKTHRNRSLWRKGRNEGNGKKELCVEKNIVGTCIYLHISSK